MLIFIFLKDIRLAEVARLKAVEDARLAMIAANVACLKRGITVTKHPRKGNPEERQIWLTDDCTQFCIAKKGKYIIKRRSGTRMEHCSYRHSGFY